MNYSVINFPNDLIQDILRNKEDTLTKGNINDKNESEDLENFLYISLNLIPTFIKFFMSILSKFVMTPCHRFDPPPQP